MEIEVGDKVKYFIDEYSTIPSYGTVVKVTPKFADVKSIVWGVAETTRVRKSKLCWSH